MNRGQITFTIATVLAGATGILGVVGSYYGTQLAQADKISTIQQQVAVLQESKENFQGNLTEIKNDVKELNAKVDALLINQGINPNKLPK